MLTPGCVTHAQGAYEEAFSEPIDMYCCVVCTSLMSDIIPPSTMNTRSRSQAPLTFHTSPLILKYGRLYNSTDRRVGLENWKEEVSYAA